jgi:hypothetical protein
MFPKSISKPGWGIIVAIIIVGIPIYCFSTWLIHAPWGKADIDDSVRQMIVQVAAKSRDFPRIILDRRLSADDTLHNSTWRGKFVYNGTVNGNPAKLRIMWEEIVGINTITSIEKLNDDSRSTMIWTTIGPNQSQDPALASGTPPAGQESRLP